MLSDDRVFSNMIELLLASAPVPAMLKAVLERRPNPRSSTSQSEIVTCVLANGCLLTLLCKYDLPSSRAALHHRLWGHRQGNGYEAEVYRRVLEPIRAGTARFFGARRVPGDGATWLLLEYLERVNWFSGTAQLRAALWLGRFHRVTEPLTTTPETSFLTRYDQKYYAGWAHRTAEFAKPLRHMYPWVEDVCGRFADSGAGLLESRPTIIHGEYCGRNLLRLRDRQLCVVDWESCAVGASEVDLAMLCDGWPDDVKWRVVNRYVRQRWPKGAPDDFGQRLAMANMYSQLRWLGQQPDWTLRESSRARFDKLLVASEHAGLLR